MNSKEKSEYTADIQERAALMNALQGHLNARTGTQADKAKSLGITQPRLNDLLKDRIDKFSLDALVSLAGKAGLRVDVNVQEVQIRKSSRMNSSQNRYLHSTFAPQPEELGGLDSVQGTRLFLRLLRCETISTGLSPKDVVLSLKINTKDGGIDAKVDNAPHSSGLLEKGSTHYQIKTGSSFKPWQISSLKKELFGKSNATPSKSLLGEAIKSCLDENGSYVVVTFGQDLLPNQHTSAIDKITELLESCGYQEPKVKVYGQGQLSGEIDKYPSICLDLVGLDEGGFLSIEGWKRNSQMKVPIKLGNPQELFINDIRNSLEESSTQHVRIIGEPGIGKTRLVLEALSTDIISSSVIYVPTGEDFQKSKLFRELLKPDRKYSAILVVDDCDNHDRASIWSAVKGQTNIKLITIDHGPENSSDSSMKTFNCPELPEEQIKQILFSYLEKNIDLHKWAGWCDGSPRVAHAVGENLKSNPDDLLKSPADVPIWDRFIIGHKEMESNDAEQHRIVLRHIALFHRFGFEHPVNDEAQFICELVQKVDPTIRWGKFQTIIQYYRNKRILQGRHTLFIVPKALHIYLWVEFWVNHGRGFKFQQFFESVPESMKRWFLQLFIYAHAPEPAQNIVKEILSSSGPFSEKDFLLSKTGMRFISYLAEADPVSTLTLLENTIGKWNYETLSEWHTGRQNIVWSLEKIVAWKDSFTRAVKILISMALAENAPNSNNSKGLLLSLFSIGLGWAPTQAPPSMRLPILKKLVKSTDQNERELGFEMCEKWLDTYGGSRIIGAEYQGMKKTIEFWRPETYGELYDCWRQVLRFLRDEVKGMDLFGRNKVSEIITSAANRLVQNPEIAPEVMDIIFELVEDNEISRKPFTKFVIWELKQRTEKLDKNTLKKIRELDNKLTGTSLWDKTRRFVLDTDWDEDYTFQGEEDKELKVRVKTLAKEYMKDASVFVTYLPKLLQEAGHRLPQLGAECGILSKKELLDEEILKQLKLNSKDINGEFLGGYLSGIRKHDETRWESLLSTLLHNDEFRELAIDCMWRSGVTEAMLQSMLILYEDKKLYSSAFGRFTFSNDMENISEKLFIEIILTLIRNRDEKAIIISIELVHTYYFDRRAPRDFPEDVVFDVITIGITPEKNKHQMYGYYWRNIAEGFLKKHPNRGLELFKNILINLDSISHVGNTDDYAKIADQVVIAQPFESWKIVSEIIDAESKQIYELTHWLGDPGFDDTPKKGAIAYMPAKEIMHWVKQGDEKKSWFIESILPKTLDLDNGGELTRFFIEEYCDDEKMSRSLFVHFHMRGWNGPESLYLSRKRDVARKWLSEINSVNIQSWLGKYIDYLSNRIESCKITEEREF